MNNEYNIKYICIHKENSHFISHVYKYTFSTIISHNIYYLNNWRDRR